MYSFFFWKSSTTCLLPVFFYRSSFEGFFASKGAAYALPDGDFARRATKHGGKGSKGLHYANKVFFDQAIKYCTFYISKLSDHKLCALNSEGKQFIFQEVREDQGKTKLAFSQGSCN